MKIIVLVKQVPDSTEIRVDKVTGTLIRAGVPSIINPDDLAGVEAALQLKEKMDATVTIVSMGPPQAAEKCLGVPAGAAAQCGADPASPWSVPYPAAPSPAVPSRKERHPDPQWDKVHHKPPPCFCRCGSIQ